MASTTGAAAWPTSVGRKLLMAASGVVMYGYVVAHMAGNLKIFTGREHFDDYAAFLRRIGEPVLGHSWFLWIMRPLLVMAVVVHVWAAAQLTLQARRARPLRYDRFRPRAGYASRTMRIGGVVILAFLVFHVLHLTTGTVYPGGQFEHGAVYENTVSALEVWWISGLYLAAMLALSFHLFHGVWSALQTLGLNTKARDRIARRFAAASAVVVGVGFSVVPLAVVTGLVD